MITKTELDKIDRRAAQKAGLTSRAPRGKQVARMIAATVRRLAPTQSKIRSFAKSISNATKPTEQERKFQARKDNKNRVEQMSDKEIAKLSVSELPRVDGILQRRLKGLFEIEKERRQKEDAAIDKRDADRQEVKPSNRTIAPEPLGPNERILQPGDNETIQTPTGAVRQTTDADGTTRFIRVETEEQKQAVKKAKAKEDKKAIVEASRTPDPMQTINDIEVPDSGKMPGFYQQEFNGKTLDQLIQMRDWKRAQVPSQYKVSEWKNAIRQRINDWAVEATKPEAAKYSTPAAEVQPSSSISAPAESPAGNAFPESPQVAGQSPPPGGKNAQTVALSMQDRSMLAMRPIELIRDKERFQRYTAIRSGEHPDTGERINLESEKKLARKDSGRSAREAIVEATAVQGQGADLTPEGIAEASETPNRRETALDSAQLAADAVGVLDPTPITDGLNGLVSIGRAFTEPERRGEHIKNAVISGISMIPYVGDLAKLGKAGSAGKTVKNAARLSDASKATKAVEKGATKYGELPLDAIKMAGEKIPDIPLPKSVINEERGSNLFESMLKRGFDSQEIIGSYFRREVDNGASERDAAETARRKLANDSGDRRPSDDTEGVFGGPTTAGSGSGGGGNDNAAVAAAMGDDGDDAHRKSLDAIEDEIEGRKRSKKSMEGFLDKLLVMFGAFGKATAVAIGVLEGARMANKGVLLSNQYLADYNPQVAIAYANRELEDIRRSIRKGRDLADPLERASETDSYVDEVRDRFTTPVTSIFVDMESTFTRAAWSVVSFADNVTHASDGLNLLSKAASKAAGLADRALKLDFGGGLKDDRDKDTQMAHFLDDISDGTFDGKTDRDRFFDGDKPDPKKKRGRRGRGS